MSPDTASIEQVGEALLQGKLIAYPTEAVWGLGCDPFNEQAVKRLLQLKNRPVEKGLILVAASLEQILPYLDDKLSEDVIALLTTRQQTPVTWLVPFKKKLMPEWITGGHSRLAIRISDHPIVQEICLIAGKPIVSTSANTSGYEPATESSGVQACFGDEVLICEGAIGSSTQPSKIIDCLTGEVVRE